jgi:hypothetical protein
MLADLDHLNAQLVGKGTASSVAMRHRRLLERFQDLRDLLSAHPHRNGVAAH